MSLQEVLIALGDPLVELQVAPRGLDVAVLDVVIMDPDDVPDIRPGDLEVVYSPLPPDPVDTNGGVEEEDVLPDLGCMHYKRNVKVQCFDCRQWYSCRHCHDAAHDLPFVHNLNRKKTQNMLCMLCQTPQPAG